MLQPLSTQCEKHRPAVSKYEKGSRWLASVIIRYRLERMSVELTCCACSFLELRDGNALQCFALPLRVLVLDDSVVIGLQLLGEAKSLWCEYGHDEAGNSGGKRSRPSVVAVGVEESGGHAV